MTMTAIFARVPSQIATETGEVDATALARIQAAMNKKIPHASVSMHPVIKKGSHMIVIVASSEVFVAPKADDAIWRAFLAGLEAFLGYRVD